LLAPYWPGVGWPRIGPGSKGLAGFVGHRSLKVTGL
jgi:hypothetical protein